MNSFSVYFIISAQGVSYYSTSHFIIVDIEMKDYFREQSDNTISFNLVNEVASFAAELERSVEENVALGTCLFRFLNECIDGSPGNQVQNTFVVHAFQLSLVDAKLFQPITHILRKLPANDKTEVVQLKVVIFQLMLSLVEGLFPKHKAPNSVIPSLMLSTLDFNNIEKCLDEAWAVSRSPNADSDLQQMCSQLCTNIFVLLKILDQYDEETEMMNILHKPTWSDFVTKNIASIEVLNSQGELCKVCVPTISNLQIYFKIPEICGHLSDETKKTFMLEVKR